MTYADFIQRVHDKVRISDDWPEGPPPTGEQMGLAYLAGIAVATELPLQSFPAALFTSIELADPHSSGGGIDRYELPSTLFRYRQDLGIASIEIGDNPMQLDEAQPLTTLRRLAVNPFYKDSAYLAVNLADRRVYVTGGCPVRINHLAEFAKPDPGGAGGTGYPLEGTHAERAASIVATHVQGEIARDSAAAQFQALLQRQYTTAPAPQPEQTD